MALTHALDLCLIHSNINDCALDSGRSVGNGKRDGNELIDFVASNDLMDMDYKSIEDPLQP